MMEVKTVPVVYSPVYDSIMDDFSAINSYYESLLDDPNQDNQWLLCSLLASSVSTLAGRILYFVDYNAAGRGLHRTDFLTSEQVKLLQCKQDLYKSAVNHPAMYARCTQDEMNSLYSVLAVEFIDLFKLALAVRERTDKVGGAYPEECGTRVQLFFKRVLRSLLRKPMTMPRLRTEIYFTPVSYPGCAPDMCCVEQFLSA